MLELIKQFEGNDRAIELFFNEIIGNNFYKEDVILFMLELIKQNLAYNIKVEDAINHVIGMLKEAYIAEQQTSNQTKNRGREPSTSTGSADLYNSKKT